MSNNKETIKQIQDLIKSLPQEEAVSLLDQELSKLKEVNQVRHAYSGGYVATTNSSQIVTPKQTSYGIKAFNPSGMQTK